MVGVACRGRGVEGSGVGWGGGEGSSLSPIQLESQALAAIKFIGEGDVIIENCILG